MSHSLTTDEQEDLLRKYAPVLRFSAGEKFFPMKVEDYLSICPRLYAGKERIREWESLETGDDRSQYLAKEPSESAHDFYLRMLPREFKADILPKAVLTGFVFVLTFLIIFGIAQLASNIPELALGMWGWIKIILLGIGIVTWPFIGADSKVHAAVILNLLGIFFFGTVYSLGIGILGLAVLAGFAVVFVVFRLFYRKIRTSLLHGICFFPILLISGLAGLFLDFFDPGTPGYWLVTSLTTGVFYAMLLVSPQLPQRISKELKAIVMLGVVTVLALGLCMFGTRTSGVDPIYIWVAVISLSGIALLWYALDPLPITKPGLLIHNNTREEVFDWNGRILSYITLTFMIFVFLNLIIIFGRPARFQAYTAGNMLHLVIAFVNNLVMVNVYILHNVRGVIHFFVAVLNLILTTGILGTRVISYLMDLFSRLYDSDAVKAKMKYDNLFEDTKKLTDFLKPVVTQIAETAADPGTKIPTRLLAQFLMRMAPTVEKKSAEKPRYWYYGRVCQEKDWILLQYNFLYAFNDWRSTAGGMNNHEGDWECLAIFLNNDQKHLPEKLIEPFGMAYSQHHHGVFRFWEDVKSVAVKNGSNAAPEYHPLVYVALGSHANYPEPIISPPSVHFSGQTRKIVTKLEQFIQSFRAQTFLVDRSKKELNTYMRLEEDGKSKGFTASSDALNFGHRGYKVLEYLKSGVSQAGFGRSSEEENKNRSEFTAMIVKGADLVTGSLEFAAGDGMRIGYSIQAIDYKQEVRFAPNLPEAIVHRESELDGRPVSRPNQLGWDWGLPNWPDWNFKLIDDATSWVGYTGLWGRFVNVEGENGPRGPKWEIDPDHLPSGTPKTDAVRIRWGGRESDYYLEWLDVLLLEISQSADDPTGLRKKALQYLAKNP